MITSRITVGHPERAFRYGDDDEKKMQVQFACLCVLYDDLTLEFTAAKTLAWYEAAWKSFERSRPATLLQPASASLSVALICNLSSFICVNAASSP